MEKNDDQVKLRYYYLDEEGNHVPTEDVIEFAAKFSYDDPKRFVGIFRKGDFMISTVFLGIDHNWLKGEPQLYETCIFTGGLGGDVVERYSTRAEALKGHQYWCSLIYA